MPYKVNRYWMSSAPIEARARRFRRWLVFILLSSLTLLALAGAIALCAPDYSAISWALVLFATTQAAFLLAQHCRT